MERRMDPFIVLEPLLMMVMLGFVAWIFWPSAADYVPHQCECAEAKP